MAVHPPQRIPNAKIRWKISRLASIFWDQDGILLIDYLPMCHYLPMCQRGVLLISAGAIEGHVEGKTPRRGKVTKGVFCLHDNAPAHRALANPTTLAYLGFQCLYHPTLFSGSGPV
jgi:hypothetical protein